MKQSLLILFIAVAFAAPAQPSCSTNFFFRLYDKGKLVKTKKQLSRYAMYDQWGRAEVIEGPDTAGYFRAHLGAIYPPFIFSVVKGADTMSLYLMDKNRTYRAPRLEFRKGLYAVDGMLEDKKRDKQLREYTLPTDAAKWKAVKFSNYNDVGWWDWYDKMHKR